MAVTHYAILMGIDEYPTKPLKSCVRDVQDVKEYLGSSLKDYVAIYMITASQACQTSPDSAKGSQTWPTYDNILSTFNTVTSLARAGNFVYIHYSGHGTQKPPCGEYSNKPQGDLALVLLSGGKENHVTCLWGSELATLLKAMVDKGLVVTLVLDCCFSASVYRREDSDIRFLPYGATIDSDYPQDPEENAGLGDTCPESEYRDASMCLNWLIKPDGYAILAACGPNEETTGCKINGQNRGALSYFLLETVKRVSLTKRHNDIYNHLRAKFQGSGLPQNPVLYGNKNQGFFGLAESDAISPAVPIIGRPDGTLQLTAGRAHGVSDGDQFVLYPFDSAESGPRSQAPSVVARVVYARGLTAELEQLGDPCISRTGWMARARAQFHLQKFPICLTSSLPHQVEWLMALKVRPLTVHTDAGKPFALQVVLDNDEEYKILDSLGQEISNLPSMPQNQAGIDQIGVLLEHLVRFSLVKHLTHESSADTFWDSIDIRLHSDGKVLSPGCGLEVNNGARAELVVENRGIQDIYVFVYDLGPYWQVEGVSWGTYNVVTPLSISRKRLQMNFPRQMEESGYRLCDDTIKVIVTSQPTSFDLLELPNLGGRSKTKTGRISWEGDGLENWAVMDFFIHISS
ncbi:hypothetical protein BDW59DRAFT_155115 [Aspergillus cavernicola]|uniref:Peptidase C14 caspase domain-containing protein n=1 Tax=Aspergillus cavernicola TaxID=176166 RepID=A0ABR4HBM9_9EURO